MKCFHHNDLDGRAAAFCVHAWAGINGPHTHNDCMREISYGTPFPFSDIIPGEQVWIVDYSIRPDEMVRLLEITPDVTWIDHHKTAIEKYADFPHPVRGIRQDGVAACVLTWSYLHWWTGRGQGREDFSRVNLVIPVPRCILLTGDRDIWAWKYGDETRFFCTGSELYDTSPTSDFWWRCMDHEVEPLPLPNTGNAETRKRGMQFWTQLLHDGEVVEKYKAQRGEEISSMIGYETEFEGYRCFACNRARASSDQFGNRIKEYDILIPHYHDGRQWTVSLYSEKVDVSVIAKARGGGGHKGASGFQCAVLPFRCNVDSN